MKIKAFSQEGGGIIWVISGIALASCGGGGGGGSSSGGGRTPVTRPEPNPIPDPTPTPDPNPNNSPIILRDTNRNEVGSYTGSVDEDGGNADLPTISASADGATPSQFDYFFLNETGVVHVDPGFNFRIDSNSGEITIHSFNTLDYETATSHTLTVRVTYDEDGDFRNTDDQITRDVQVVIDVGNVIDQSEDIILMQDGNEVGSYTGSVDEDGGNADLPTISASADGATPSQFDYFFLNETGVVHVDPGFNFRIDSNSGEITIHSFNTLDYETATSHTLTVRVTYDEDGDFRNTDDQIIREVQVVITVNDVEGIRFKNADGDVVDSYTAPVDEDAAGGTSIVTIDASVDDAPSGHIFTYQFPRPGGGTSNTDEGRFFQISSSGEITVLGLGTLDYDTATSHTLTVRVTYDSNGNTAGGDIHTRDVQVVVNVNDPDEQASPAIIPDRQAFAHQDPYDPDDLGLTPMPDADPSAG